MPIGNGRLSCMISGDAAAEHIQFNEDSLWIGDEQDTGAYQAFGDLHIEMPGRKPSDCRRQFDIRFRSAFRCPAFRCLTPIKRWPPSG